MIRKFEIRKYENFLTEIKKLQPLFYSSHGSVIAEFEVEMIQDNEVDIRKLVKDEIEGNPQVAYNYGIDPLSVSTGNFKYFPSLTLFHFKLNDGVKK